MDNLAFGLGVTLTGLGIVFGILALLWLLLSAAIRLDRRAGVERGAVADGPDPARPAASPVAAASPASPAAPLPAELDPRLVAAITVAIVRHADERRRQAAPAMRSYWPGSLLFASRWVGSGRARQAQPWRRRAR